MAVTRARTWLWGTIAAVALVGVVGVRLWLALADTPAARFLLRLYADHQFLRTELQAWGVWAPLVFMAIQALQVVIAPIPGELTGWLGGFVFGQGAGFVYSMVGLTAGSLLAFAVGRRLGTAVVRRLVSPEVWRRLGFIVEAEGAILCFILYLIPGFPKDVLCYLFGLSPMPFWLFAVASTAGRMPSTWVLSAQGAQAAGGHYVEIALLTALVAALALPLYVYRHRLVQWTSAHGVRARDPGAMSHPTQPALEQGDRLPRRESPEMATPPGRLTTHAATHWMTTAARLGHLSTGTVHGLVGVLALIASMNPQTQTTGFQGALHDLASRSFGTILLIVLGAGLIADSLWQAMRAATDADMAGPGLRGTLERVGWLVSGLLHLGLGVGALRLVREVPAGPPVSRTKAWTALAMALPFGRWLVALVALTTLAVAGVMIVRAGRAALDPWLDLPRMSRNARILTKVLGRVGLATRAIVYSIIAGFLLLAAVQADPLVARGVTGTLRAIRFERYGTAILAAIGIGFVANGALEMIRAWYRRTAS